MTDFAAPTAPALDRTSPMKKPSPWVMLPGLAFWGLLGAGFYTEDTRFFSVAVGVAAVAIASKLAIAWRRSDQERAEVKRLWLEGTPRQAEIVAISSNGGMNGHPRVTFELQIRTASAPHRARAEVIVDKLAIPRIQPGTVIGVRVDPRDPSRVLIDEALTYLGYQR